MKWNNGFNSINDNFIFFKNNMKYCRYRILNLKKILKI